MLLVVTLGRLVRFLSAATGAAGLTSIADPKGGALSDSKAAQTAAASTASASLSSSEAAVAASGASQLAQKSANDVASMVPGNNRASMFGYQLYLATNCLHSLRKSEELLRTLEQTHGEIVNVSCVLDRGPFSALALALQVTL